MKKLIILILTISINAYSMDTNSFSQLKENMRGSLDQNNIDMLKELSSETYTSQQVKEILEMFSLANYRVDAFRILASKVEDPQNKSVIMSAFQNDLASYKKNAYSIYNSIKGAAPKKKEEAAEDDSANKKKKEPLTGTLTIAKSVDNCGFGYGVYGLSDEVTPSFRLNRKIGTTSYSLWVSYCTSKDHNSCRTPFSKETRDILPDWDGLQYSSPVSVRNLLTNNGSVSLPNHSTYNISIIVNNKLVAETMININRNCK